MAIEFGKRRTGKRRRGGHAPRRKDASFAERPDLHMTRGPPMRLVAILAYDHPKE
jgi:hypothetical protein